jgi:hypothetical protein
MEFRVFDISQDPFELGFVPGSYDLILAANVVHATPNLTQTLQNLHPPADISRPTCAYGVLHVFPSTRLHLW